MDAVSLVVTALPTGASAEAKERRLAGGDGCVRGVKGLSTPGAGRATDRRGRTGGTRARPADLAAPLAAQLTAVGAADEADLIAAARALLNLADPAGKYQVDARGAQDVQVGDGNFQRNTFGLPGQPGPR